MKQRWITNTTLPSKTKAHQEKGGSLSTRLRRTEKIPEMRFSEISHPLPWGVWLLPCSTGFSSVLLYFMHESDRVFAMTNSEGFVYFYLEILSLFSHFFCHSGLSVLKQWTVPILNLFIIFAVQLLISWGGFLLEEMACDIPQTGNPIHTSLSRCSLTKSSSWSCFMSQNGTGDKRRAKGSFYSLATGK